MEGRAASQKSEHVIPEPETAHTPHTSGDYEDDDREATELRDARHPITRIPISRLNRPQPTPPRWYDPIRKFWRHQVRTTVPHDDCRDHFANERTFLAYLRTSVALSMIGVLIAQLYRLQHAPETDPLFGYFVLSRPLACIFQCAAGSMILLGAFRFWRQQNAMARGKVHAGGWEVLTICIGSFLVCLPCVFYVRLSLMVWSFY